MSMKQCKHSFDVSGTCSQEKAPPAQAHLLKVRELMLPAADEPDEDQTEAFLLAALRGNSTKVRRVSAPFPILLICKVP